MIAAKVVTYLLAGAGYALACAALGVARRTAVACGQEDPRFAAGNGNLAVLGAVVISAALFGVTGAGLGSLLGSEVVVIAGLVLYLYVAEPLISRITALGWWPPTCPPSPPTGAPRPARPVCGCCPPGKAALVFTAWAAIAAAGTVITARQDIT